MKPERKRFSPANNQIKIIKNIFKSADKWPRQHQEQYRDRQREVIKQNKIKSTMPASVSFAIFVRLAHNIKIHLIFDMKEELACNVANKAMQCVCVCVCNNVQPSVKKLTF